ncbi:hypothetical protein [Psychrobacillus sp. FSL K6-1267]|uniref:hypothetical protein n=1 Tax=Psychrobacillus sp. FSL K6-1267 TaxID=2921543 RepID=UPI0030F618B7
MFKMKSKIEVVPESDYTDFSDLMEDSRYATNKTLIAAAVVPISVATGLAVTRLVSTPAHYSSTVIPVSTPKIEPVNVLAQTPLITPTPISTPEMIPTGYIAEKSLETFANIMDPVIQILVSISFPVASVIMVGACFFFMFGNSEKAWGMIMNAGLGYVLIQLSPLFLDILREVGKAV